MDTAASTSRAASSSCRRRVERRKPALRVSSAPIIASRSSAYALAPHPRNVPDEVLVRVAKNGGVVMVNFSSGFVVRENAEKTANMFEVRRKLEQQYPDEAERTAKFREWQTGLNLRRGWSERDVRKVLGDNILRALREAERVAARSR